MGDSDEEEVEDAHVHRRAPAAPSGYIACLACRQMVKHNLYLQHVNVCKVPPPPTSTSTHGEVLQQAGTSTGGAEELGDEDDAATAQQPMDDALDGGGFGARGGVEGAPAADDTGLELQQQQDRRKEMMDMLLAARKAEGARRVSLLDLQMLRVVLHLDEASASRHMSDAVRVRQSPAATSPPKWCALTLAHVRS